MPTDDREFNVAVKNSRMSTGMSSEMLVASDLFARGYQVSKPLAGDTRYDLIVDRHGTLSRVQVKTISRGSQIPIGFVKYTEDTYGRGVQQRTMPRYTGSEFEFIAAVDRDTKMVYYIPSSEIDFKKANIPFGKTARERFLDF